MVQQLPQFLQWVRPMSIQSEPQVFTPKPSNTEDKIKEIATQKQPQEVQAETYSPDRFFKDINTVKQKESIDTDSAAKAVLNAYKQRGITIEGIDIDAELGNISPQPVEGSTNTTFTSRLEDVKETALAKAEDRKWTDRNAFRTALDNAATKASVFSGVVWAWIWEAFETWGQLLSAITPDSIEDRVKNRVMEEIDMVAWTAPWQAVWTIGKWLWYTAKEVYGLLPDDVQRDVESLWDIWLGMLDAIGAGYAGKTLKNAPWAIKDASAGITEAVWKKNFLTQESRNNYIAKESEKIDKVVWQISQPWKKQLGDVEAMKKSINQVDTSDIQSYEDLSNRFSDKITSIANKQDELLPSEKIYEISSLGTKSKGGTIEVNFIENALDDMEKLYEKVWEIDNLERVRELRAWKLSVKDINDIAREYNVNFGKKAFNKDGSAKFSDIGQAFENTRKWVKEQARWLLPDDTLKILDSELSDLYSARNLSDDMVSKVAVLKNRLDERWLIANLSNKAGKIVDILTLWAPKELFSSMLLKWGMWKATLDSLTLQNRLSKNIKLIESSLSKIEKAKDARVVSEVIEDLAKTLWLTREQINTQASKAKDSLWDLADNVADKVGARAKFMWDEGTGISWKIDDFSKVGTTKSAVFIKNNGVYRQKISDVIKSDELLSKYPEIRNWNIYLQNNNWSAFEKWTAKKDMFAIYVGKNWWDNVIDTKKASKIRKQMDDLIDSWKPDSEIESQYLKLEKELDKVESEFIGRKLNETGKKIINHELQHVKQELKWYKFNKQEWLSFDEYYNLPEEVEARNAEIKYKW